MLWFDVENRYNTTPNKLITNKPKLWFDVENRYNTTVGSRINACFKLWFDVENRYNTTANQTVNSIQSCGLMQKTDIIQRENRNPIRELVVV